MQLNGIDASCVPRRVLLTFIWCHGTRDNAAVLCADHPPAAAACQLGLDHIQLLFVWSLVFAPPPIVLLVFVQATALQLHFPVPPPALVLRPQRSD